MPSEPNRVQELFRRIVELPHAERRALLERESGDDGQLRQQVEALLRAVEEPEQRRDDPTTTPAATVDCDTESRSAVTGDFPLPANDSPATGATKYETEPRPGTVIGERYSLVERIGEGGMGEVWIAQQTKPVKRRVALKLIKAGMDSRAVLARFQQERQALAMMDHPNIAHVLDGGMTSYGHPFFVMELVNGSPLTTFCDHAQLTPNARLELFVPICQAVQHAHQKGIVHRDLKPANLLVTVVDGKPVPKVIDFGVAKATGGKITDESMSTQFGSVIGTLEYMAPEQASFSEIDIDTRADIYSLGVVLYELLTGLRPVDAEQLNKASFSEMIRIIQAVEPSKPSTRLSAEESLPSLAAQRQTDPRKLMSSLRGELDWVVMKCLEKSRERRYETANALSRDIQRYLANEPVEARAPSRGYRLNKFIRRNKGAVIAATLVVLTLVGGIAGTGIGLVRAQRARAAERDRAEGERRANEQAQKRLAQVEQANHLLGSIFESLDPNEIAKSKRPLQDILLQKLDTAIKQLDGDIIGDPLEVARVQITLGISLNGLGAPDKSIDVLQRARATLKEQLGDGHSDTLAASNHLARAYTDAGKPELAQPLFKATVALLKSELGPDHPQTLACMANLGQCYRVMGKPNLAMPLLVETYEAMKEILGPEHDRTLSTMNNLAGAYIDTGRSDLALPLYEQAFQVQKAKYGRNHPHTIVAMDNLASVYQTAGKLDLSLELSRESLELLRINMGPDHPQTLISMNNLADGYRANGRPDLAVPLFEQAVRLMKSKLGPDHRNTLVTMHNLAVAYGEIGKLDLSLTLHAETLELRKAELGLDHPDTLISMNNLAGGYLMAEQLDLAVPLYEETVRLLTEKLGADHPYARGATGSLEFARRVRSVQSRYQQTLEANGPVHIDTLLARRDFAQLYLVAGRLDRAEQLFMEILARMHHRPNDDAARESTIDLLQQSLRFRKQTDGDGWKTFNSMALIGAARLEQERYEEAERQLLAGCEGMKQHQHAMPSESKGKLTDALERLVNLYEQTHNPDQAASWRSELELHKAGQSR